MVKMQPSAGLMDFSVPPAGYEVLRYTYYSRKNFAAGVLGTINFFSDQVGVAGATLRDTNMNKPNAIGNPKRFLVQFLNFDVYSELKADQALANYPEDVNAALRTGVIQIILLDKEYLTVPAWTVPAGGGTYVSASGSVALVGVNNGIPSRQNGYPLELPLEREASFNINYLNPVAPTTTVANLKFEMMITGLLLRPKQ